MKLCFFIVLSSVCWWADCARYLVDEKDDVVVIYSGELRIELWKKAYHMNVFDNVTGKPIVLERSDPGHRLGYGKWIGAYLNIYEGYLWRLGDIREWYEATTLISVSYGSNDVTAYIATNDPQNRTIELRLYDLRQRQMSFSFIMPDDSMNRVRWTLNTTGTKEDFFGFGERFNSLGQRYSKVGCWSEDGSFALLKRFPDLRIPDGATSTYAPMPLYLSSKGYGFQIDTTYRTEFDFTRGDFYAPIQIETNTFAATLYGGHNARESFTMMVEANGKSLIPPKWAFGPWNQLDREVANVNVTERAQEMLLKNDIPFSLNVHTIHFFPDGEDANQHSQILDENTKLLSMGIPSTAYFNPMVDTSFNTTYNDGASKGYFTKNLSGDPYQFLYIAARLFNVSQVDFTNPAAVSWYQKHLQQALDLQYKGWMYDYGEYTPPNSVNSLNQSGLQSHNQYPLLYQKACFDHLTANNTPGSPYAPEYLYYVRSGYAGSQKYTWAHWTGDPSSDWREGSGLDAQIRGSLTIGISGMPFSGSDIGGFEWYLEKPPSLELWVRWTQLGAFSGLMHEQGGGKGTGQKTHIFDTPTGTRLWRKFAKFRTQLFPYIYTQAHIAHQTGLPLMRAHILDFYDDKYAPLQQDQYMFGESILVAPVTEEKGKQRVVYFPLGDSWIDISVKMAYEEEDGRFRIGHFGPIKGGDFRFVNLTLDTIPLFVRYGTILPVFDPRVQVLRTAPHPNVTGYDEIKILHLWMWPTFSWTSSGYDWQNNTFSTKPLSGQDKGMEIHLNVTSSNYDTVICQVALYNNTGVSQVRIPGATTLTKVDSWKDVVRDGPTSVWTRDDEQKTLWVKISSNPPVTLDAIFA